MYHYIIYILSNNNIVEVVNNSSKSFIVDVKTKFYSKVFDQSFINYYAELTYNRRGIFKGNVLGKYYDDKICEGEFTYAVPDLMTLPTIN